MEKRIRYTIILILMFIVCAAFSAQSGNKKEKLIYQDCLEQVALIVDEQPFDLSDLAFYVAYQEEKIQKQAVLYNPDNPKQYWNLYTDGEFVKVAAKRAVVEMAVHDEIFYQMAVSENIQLEDAEIRYLKNEQTDFWTDLEEWQRERLGVEKQKLDAAMEKIALANKYQSIYAQMNNSTYEEYNFDGDAYQKLLLEHSWKVKEKVWDRVDFGNVTLDNNK